MKQKSINDLKRLSWAEGDIHAARELSEYMLGQPPEENTDYRRRSLEAGIIITYARPFGENNGLGALPKKFSQFDDSNLEKFHEKMICARNCIAGHNDRINLHLFLSEATRKEDPEKIQIEIFPDGKSEWIMKSPYLSASVLKGVVNLCRVQEERLHKESCSIIAGKSYEARIFTLGIDFP
jgi:hypothetical protein